MVGTLAHWGKPCQSGLRIARNLVLVVAFSRHFRYIGLAVLARPPHAAPPPFLLSRMTGLTVALVLLVVFPGCNEISSRWFTGAGASQGYWLPLTVGLQLDPSVTEAALAYTDSCRQPRTLPFGDRLTEALKRDIGMVFEHVLADAQPLGSRVATASDGVVEVVLGLKEVELFIHRQSTRSYPATVTLVPPKRKPRRRAASTSIRFRSGSVGTSGGTLSESRSGSVPSAIPRCRSSNLPPTMPKSWRGISGR